MNFINETNRLSVKEIVLGIIVFGHFSCMAQTTNLVKTVKILEAKKTELSISDIAKDIEYIPLANDSLLAAIMKVVYSDGEYFLIDNKSKFLRFDKNGKLLNKIGRRGMGPGEYQYINDFEIQPKTHNIYISGGKPEQLMVFLPDSKFIRSINLRKKGVRSIGISGNDIFLFYLEGAQYDKENMDLLSPEGNLIESYPNKYKFGQGRAVVGFSGECLMYSFEGKLYFKEIFSDTLFYMEEHKMKPKIVLNSGDYRFTTDIRSRINNEFSDINKFGKILSQCVIQNNILETKNYLFYSYGFDKKVRTMIFNKSTGIPIEIDNDEGIKNDLDGGPNIHLKMNKDDNTILSWLNAFELKAYVASNAFKNSTPKYPEKKKALEKLANSMNENDNPVLMLVKLKE